MLLGKRTSVVTATVETIQLSPSPLHHLNLLTLALLMNIALPEESVLNEPEQHTRTFQLPCGAFL